MPPCREREGWEPQKRIRMGDGDSREVYFSSSGCSEDLDVLLSWMSVRHLCIL